MPFVIPTVTGLEGLALDGLDLSQGEGGSIRLKTFVPPIPKKRQEWVSASDSDGAILSRVPLRDNGQAQVTVSIYGVSRDDAQTTVGTIIDKLEEADRNPAGIPLVWTPGGSTPNLTFYVLSGEITEMPVDWESGYMVNNPEVSFTLDCAPYGYGDPIDYTGSATAGPLVTLELADVPGDAPARGTLTVTEASSQSRRTVEWGAEQRYYDPGTPWSLVLDSDSLVTSGFAGTQTTLAGAFDPGASGNSIITSQVWANPQALCGTGVQPHIGTFRVKARINTGPGGCFDTYFRLSWRVGDGDYASNDPFLLAQDSTQEYRELDLGLITVPPVSTGTQSWDGRVEAWSVANNDTIYVDYLMLIPVEAGYGKAVASYSYSPGVITGLDQFTGTTAGNNLNGRTADAGGTWATSGVATDFQFADPGFSATTETIVRQTVSEASGRFAILGSSSITDAQIDVAFQISDWPVATGEVRAGVILRWTDASNYLRATYIRTYSAGTVTRSLTVTQTVAGVETVVGTTAVAAGVIVEAIRYMLRLVAFSSGRVIASILTSDATTLTTVDGVSSTLATGGTLASGKSGVYDANTSATATVKRNYDAVTVSIPTTEPITLYSGRSLEIRHDSAERESSAGGTWGRPQTYRGSRFFVQPAGDGDRTTRVVAKASRNDLGSAQDANLTDQITLTATVTPRYVFIPRP